MTFNDELLRLPSYDRFRVAVVRGEPVPQPDPCPHCQQTGVKGEASGWHRRTGPGPALRKHHDLDPWQYPQWVDHPYRVRLGDGDWCYVAEPYLLFAEAFEDFTFLIRSGYGVTISAEAARHFPSRTVAVLITERASK